MYEQHRAYDKFFSQESMILSRYYESNKRITSFMHTLLDISPHMTDWWNFSPFLEQFRKQFQYIVSFTNKNLPIGLPLHGKNVIVSPFGLRLDPIIFKTALHTGVDLESIWNQPVFSTADGWIRADLSDPAYGINVDILNQFGFSTVYAHLSSKLPLKIGSYITKGTLIGYTGNTGRSSGVHLHYEVRTGDEYLDPEDYLYLGKNLPF